MGSSPLTRGKRSASTAKPYPTGLIPAHAGKTTTTRPERRCERAHPRSRGENGYSGEGSEQFSGSSPLTRGKCSYGEAGSTWDGLIPAHAGKMSGSSPPPGCRRAHPRSRGENIAPCFHVSHDAGSSPLTRGKLCVQRRAETFLGLIPAHAGKMKHITYLKRLTRAHPRSRGENTTLGPNCCPVSGSSPLTRGKLCVQRRAETFLGLIPAHAGKIWAAAFTVRSETAHPRSRGENEAHNLLEMLNMGSSPLTRGK